MKVKKQEPFNMLDGSTHFRAVYKSDFSIERKANPSPKPSQFYHYHDCYELYYLYSGERYYFIKDKTYHITPGSIVFIAPNTIHCSANYEKSGFDRLLLNFKPGFIAPLLSAVETESPIACFKNDIHVIQLDLHERSFVETLFVNMLQEHEKASTDTEAYFKASLLHLLMFIGKNKHQLSAPPIDSANPTRRMISETIAYINDHFCEDLSLPVISEQIHISPCYMSRAFKAHTGFAFTEYLNNIRIKEAQKLLANSNLSILQVAEKAGFKSNTHFGRVFKKIVGISPLAYRKSICEQ